MRPEHALRDGEPADGPTIAATAARVRWRDRETFKTLFVNPWTYTTGAVVPSSTAPVV